MAEFNWLCTYSVYKKYKYCGSALLYLLNAHTCVRYFLLPRAIIPCGSAIAPAQCKKVERGRRT